MFEITINGTVYKFKFGIGFVREVSGRRQVVLEHGTKEDVGLEYVIAKIQEGDILTLADVLDLGNKYAGEPRLTRSVIEGYLEDESTDIERLFDDVMDFFGKSNAMKKKTRAIKEATEAAEKAQQK